LRAAKCRSIGASAGLASASLVTWIVDESAEALGGLGKSFQEGACTRLGIRQNGIHNPSARNGAKFLNAKFAVFVVYRPAP
jgi:hypothetical protein